MSSGRTSTDNCDITSKHPELIWSSTAATPLDYCHMDSPFLTQVKGMGSYTVPKIDIQVGASFQSNPGPGLQATFNATNAVVSPSLNRVLSGNAANVQVNLLPSNAVLSNFVTTPLTTASASAYYGDRVNQFDFRVGKIFRFGSRRASANLDIYNMFNSSAVLTESVAYATYRTPQIVIIPRFVKVSMQLDF